MKKSISMLIIVGILLIGCAPFVSSEHLKKDASYCHDKVVSTLELMGAPDNMDIFKHENGLSATYWYYCAGIAYTFTLYNNRCEESTYHFTSFGCDYKGTTNRWGLSP